MAAPPDGLRALRHPKRSLVVARWPDDGADAGRRWRPRRPAAEACGARGQGQRRRLCSRARATADSIHDAGRLQRGRWLPPSAGRAAAQRQQARVTASRDDGLSDATRRRAGHPASQLRDGGGRAVPLVRVNLRWTILSPAACRMPHRRWRHHAQGLPPVSLKHDIRLNLLRSASSAALACSGAPSELNFPFLEQLHLKKVIYLALDEPTETFSTFVSVRCHHHRHPRLLRSGPHLARCRRCQASKLSLSLSLSLSCTNGGGYIMHARGVCVWAHTYVLPTGPKG